MTRIMRAGLVGNSGISASSRQIFPSPPLHSCTVPKVPGENAGNRAEMARGAHPGPLVCSLRAALADSRLYGANEFDGLVVRQIAERLALSTGTVHAHVRNAIGKLQVGTRTAAVALAVRFSYLDGGGWSSPGFDDT